MQIRDLIAVAGYLSQSDSRAHFGLGKAKTADSVEIRWPDGRKSQLKNVPTGKILKIVQEPKAK